MKLKFILLFIAISNFSYTICTAQKFGISGSVGYSKAVIPGGDSQFKDKGILGFHLGPIVNFSVSDSFNIETAIWVSSKGYRSDIDLEIYGIQSESKSVLRINYVEIPVIAIYTFRRVKIPILIGAGPVLGIALFGNTKTKMSFEDETETENYKIEFGTEPDEVKRVDLGILFKGGIRLKSTDIAFFYNIGMLNLANDGNYKNRMLGITVSQWLFTKIK